MGCRTQAWATIQATADSAWAGMTAGAGHRRRVCGAAPQSGELLKAHYLTAGVPGPAGLLVVGLDLEGPNHRIVAW